jgi:AAA15 family ATPase/GTPase
MIAGSLKTHKHHVYNVGKLNVLRSSVIYGANGAGKSNLIKAISFLKDVVVNSGIDQTVNDKKFKLNSDNIDKPISLEVEFSVESKIYSFGISLNNREILEEWLYETSLTGDDKLIYERTLNKEGKIAIKMAAKYSKTQKEKLLIEIVKENLLKNDKLLLGLADLLKIEELSSVRNWLLFNLTVIFPEKNFHGILPILLSTKDLKEFYDQFVRYFDPGINQLISVQMDLDKYLLTSDLKMTRQQIQDQVDKTKMILNDEKSEVIIKENDKIIVKKAISYHRNSKNEDVIFLISEESDGTRRLIDLTPAFYNILKFDHTYVIDEIDQSIHPSMLCAIIRNVMKMEQTKGQLIFTSHESNLLNLELFRQDEIWFVEKDEKNGDSKLYSLNEFKPRYDLDIRKGYLKGRFGAIPFLANVQDLNW